MRPPIQKHDSISSFVAGYVGTRSCILTSCHALLFDYVRLVISRQLSNGVLRHPNGGDAGEEAFGQLPLAPTRSHTLHWNT